MKKQLTILFTVSLFLFAIKANSQWTTVCGTGNGFVDNFENYNGELYATGFFNTICGVSCNYVAKYNGTFWQAVGNGFPYAGHHLKVIDSVLYGLGYQPNVDSNWVYKFDGTNFNKMGEGIYLTTAVTGFSQLPNLYKIIKYNGNIFVTGEFDRVGSRHISGIMQWNGTQWDSVGSGITGHNPLDIYPDPIMYPHDMCLFGSSLIVCGTFEYAGGQVADGIASWDGTQWHSMGSGFNGAVYGTCVYNGELYVSGDFTMSGSTPLKCVAKWNGTSWVNPGFTLYYNNSSYYSFAHTLKVMNNKLVISGGFDRVATATDTMHCQAVMAFDGTSIDTLSGGLINEEAEALAMYNGLLFAGGGLNNISYVGSYNLSTGIADIHQPNNTVTVSPNPFSNQTTITSTKYQVQSIKIMDVMGRLVRSEEYGVRRKEVVIEKGELNNGIYFIQITDEKKNVTNKKIVME